MENELCPRQIDLHIARRKPLFGRFDSRKRNLLKKDPDDAKEDEYYLMKQGLFQMLWPNRSRQFESYQEGSG